MDVSKVRWFAGLHENTDNRHIHLCFYELEPERIVAHQPGRRWHRGKMSQASIESFKVRIEQTLSSGEFALGSERRALMDGLGGALDEKTESDRKAKKALLNLYRVLPRATSATPARRPTRSGRTSTRSRRRSSKASPRSRNRSTGS
jgi:hypothetical protein